MTRSLLLDTCALLWLGNAPERFSAQAISEIESAPILYASPISLWEVALKCQTGKLKLEVTPEVWFDTLKSEYGIVLLPLNEDVMLKSASLPFHHRDPADRFIIASAMLRNLPVVTGDHRFGEYGIVTLE